MEIAVMLYPEFTALDCIGPYEVLQHLPGADLKFVAAETGVVRADTGRLGIQVDHAIADVPAPDVVLVPGGPGDEGAAADERVTSWLAKVHQTTKWTTSVCTGSIVLGAAGILDGLEATTHWARYDRLAEFGAKPTSTRVVRQGKVLTAAGVSAGIDMALTLASLEAGEDFAKGLQLAIEYDPQPPFDSGSPAKAPEHVMQMMMAYFAESEQARRQTGA